MNQIKWWDEYEIKARYLPTFLSIIPLVHFMILFIDQTFWRELVSNISWMLVFANLSLSLIVMLALVQFQCSFAKHFIEEPIFGRGGGRFPTTDMLLYNGGLISLERKELIRTKISNHFKCKFSTESEEKNNPSNARLQAREAVGHVRIFVGKGIITIYYNIRYGFFRNLIAGVIWSTIGSIGCSVLYAIRNDWKVMSFFIIYLLVFLTLFIFRKIILERLAFTYADTLFNEFLNQNKGDKK